METCINCKYRVKQVCKNRDSLVSGFVVADYGVCGEWQEREASEFRSIMEEPKTEKPVDDAYWPHEGVVVEEPTKRRRSKK